MKFDDEAIARGVMAFVSTLRHTAGLNKQQVKHALHPKMIDMIWAIEDKREQSASKEKQG
jgi:hypothetical protein